MVFSLVPQRHSMKTNSSAIKMTFPVRYILMNPGPLINEYSSKRLCFSQYLQTVPKCNQYLPRKKEQKKYRKRPDTIMESKA